MNDPHAITSEAELRDVIAEPHPSIQVKVFEHVDSFARDFIAKSPIVMVSTNSPEHGADVSPKGDAPGFVVVESDSTLLIPERPGNKLAYGFRNLLANPQIGLIFIVPGVTETLRINGRAELTKDPAILERLSARNKPALLATRVHVEESFFHCGKAFIRSKLWKPETWPEGMKANLGKQFASRMNAGEEVASEIDAALEKNYEEELY